MPQFYYNHKPGGSPDDDFDFPGVEPTGPLPASVDFPLTRKVEPEEFSVIMMGDPQPTTRQQVRYYANDLIAELVDSQAAFGISLGDIVGNDLSLFDNVNAVQAKVGVPWHNVLGNHDINFLSPNDKYSDETFERVYGPANYAFQWASVHFIVLDNVRWNGPVLDEDGKLNHGNYSSRFTKDQLQFVANYVAEVPVNECLVICTHVPLFKPKRIRHGTKNLEKLLKILAKHPHQLSFSAHTHFTRQDFIGGAEDQYFDHHTDGESHHHHHFQLQIHHHHNTATGSGSWFRGPKDEQGLPMTPMRDGVPNGYLIATFTGNNYKLRYKAARQPKDFQMSIHAPETTFVSETSQTEILVNVFNGNEKTNVRMRVRGVGDWITMAQTEREDPGYRAIYERDLAYEKRPHALLPDPVPTPHIWTANLPSGIEPGVHVLEVISTDMFGQIDRGIRLIEIDADPPLAEVDSVEVNLSEDSEKAADKTGEQETP